MKKIFILTALAVAAMSLAACKTDQIVPEAPEATLAIEKSELIIPAKGGEAFLVVKSESAFKATAEKEWCNVTIDKDTVRISAAANGMLDSRYSKVTLTNAEESTSVMIQQFGFKTSSFGPADITCSSDAIVYDFPYEYDEVLEASANQDWVTLTITENNLNVSIAENTVQATADNKSRKAEISWTLGIDAGTIKIEQLNVDFMQPDANWTVAYEGYKVYEGDGNKYEHISNTVADPTISGMYYFTYFAKDEYTASKLKMGDFIATLVPTLKAEADDIIDYYKSAGYNLSYEDLLYEDSDYEIFDKFDDGDYYACVVGFDKNFEPTGHYAVAEFTKKNDGPATGYAAWLGDWKCPHGNSTTKFDTWTFTEKEKGLTYWVTGIEGYTDLKIEVEYDEASEGIIVRAQEEIGTMTIGSKGECSMGFYGATLAGNLWTPGANPYAIFTATIDGNSAQLVPATLSTNTGDVQPEIAAYIGKDSNGGFTLPKSFSDATRTNVVLTKEGGSSDDPGTGGGTGSADFNKFIGSWTVSPADNTREDWTTRLVEVTPDAEIAAYDWQDWSDDWVTPATVTYKDKKIAFKGGTGVPLAEGVELGDPADPFTVYYMGSAMIDGQSYVITSGESMYDACQGEFDKDGNIVLTGLDVQLSDGGTYTFVDYGVVAIGADDNTIYTFLNEAGEFPVTMRKASGSKSVKTFGNNRWNLSLENAVKVNPSHVLKMKEPELVEMTACVAKSEPARTPKFIVK